MAETIAQLLVASPNFDLACVGTAAHTIRGFSLESIRYIHHADVVFFYPVSASHLAFVKTINQSVVNMHDDLYAKGAGFGSAYSTIVAKVMDRVRRGERVAYAVQGSPALFCGTALRLHRIASNEGRRTVMIPGLSSLDLLMTKLAVEHDLSDLRICSAGRIAARSSLLDPRHPTMVFNFGRYAMPAVRETDVTKLHKTAVSHLAALLAKNLPDDHIVMNLTIHHSRGCFVSRAPARDLERLLLTSKPTSTLFIPAVQLAAPNARTESTASPPAQTSNGADG